MESSLLHFSNADSFLLLPSFPAGTRLLVPFICVYTRRYNYNNALCFYFVKSLTKVILLYGTILSPIRVASLLSHILSFNFAQLFYLLVPFLAFIICFFCTTLLKLYCCMERVYHNMVSIVVFKLFL